MIININNPPLHAVEISRQGENAFREIVIDVSAWLAEYIDGKISVIYCRPDGELYPVIVNANESPIVWRPTATDTAVAGKGAIEVRITYGNVLGKSCTIAAKVLGALGAPGDAPAAPAPDWAQQVAEDAESAAAAAEKAEAASTHMPQISASKTWLVWDADAGEYVDSGVSAAGAKGDDGDPGKAPIIGSNGNWYEWDDAAGTYTDTGKPSRGEKGETGAAGADGNDGRDGTDGITPTIGENGNWYLGDTDTGKPSRGKDGATGATGATGEKGADGKSAYAYAVDGGYTGTEEEFAAKLAEEMPDKLPNPNALTFTGAVTGTYDGSEPVTVNIPSGGSSGGSVSANIEKVYSWTADGTVQSNLDSLAIEPNKIYFCELLVPMDSSMSAGSVATPKVYVRIGTNGNTYTGCIVGYVSGQNKHINLLSKYTFFVDSGIIHIVLDRVVSSQNVPNDANYTKDQVYIYSVTSDMAILAGTTVNIYKMG
ncbi:MAG: hypothetical protein U0N08_01825 [Oscillospiraceae bacterium]